MLSFLHTPPTSPATQNNRKRQLSPEYIAIKPVAWSSPESETELCKKRRVDEVVKREYELEEERYSECTRLFDNPEDVYQAISLLRTRKNVDIKNYSHHGTFIPNVLLTLSQSPRLSTKHPAPRANKAKSECPRPYVCEYCGKQFTNIGNLATHSRTHTKEKPYKCNKCDLDFAHTSNLQRHQLVHSGQRNNKCPHCSKCFSRSDYLKVHERTHTGEKPYACTVPECTKRFLDSSSLKKHERTHTGDRPFACHICYKTYTESSKLKAHLQTHTTKATKAGPIRTAPYPAMSTQTLPNPLYPSVLDYTRVIPYQPTSIPKPTPTRPTPTRYHPYSTPRVTLATAPRVTLATAPSNNILMSQRYSAFLPFPV